MDNVRGGITLIFIGIILGFITYKKYSIFWESHNTKVLRKFLGDNITSVVLYILGILFVVFGFLVSKGIVL